mmetsp:Transcript_30804/g.46729  ORF Transcript_30804/g.46729 Transcript_30804/m.46729 type:complete len:282 (+) Transcript_30804:44-889(+)
MVTHLHICSPRLSENSQENEIKSDGKDSAPEISLDFQICLIIFCEREGVFWRGLIPLLTDAPPKVIVKSSWLLLDFFIFNRESRKCSKNQIMDTDIKEIVDLAPINLTLDQSVFINDAECGKQYLVQICLYPPQITQFQRSFTFNLIRYERLFLSLQCLSAYLATLGGGYFLCWQLESALKLAKYQRSLALWMGDEATADKCTLNEAFNYMHSGLFNMAQRRICAVEASAKKRKDDSTLRIVQAATIFLQRMKVFARLEKKMIHPTINNFQRVRIVEPTRS